MFINRNFNRTEKDDFALNVVPFIGSDNEAIPCWDIDGNMIGWNIQGKFE